jgi:hypothetical protein
MLQQVAGGQAEGAAGGWLARCSMGVGRRMAAHCKGVNPAACWLVESQQAEQVLVRQAGWWVCDAP